MAFRCETTGRSVNLLPMDKPADIYAEVAVKTEAALKEIAGQNCSLSEIVQDEGEAEKAALQQKAAKWWLEYGITRKVTKRNTMCYAYGSNLLAWEIAEQKERPAQIAQDAGLLIAGRKIQPEKTVQDETTSSSDHPT